MAVSRQCCAILVVLGMVVAEQRTGQGGIHYGNPCDENTECSTFGTGAVCRKGRCVCDEEFFINHTRCLYKRGLGESCHRPEFGCYLQTGAHLNAVCEKGICACASGFVPNLKSGECLQVAQSFGDICELNNQCGSLGAGTVCKEGKCICDGDSFFDGDKCLYKKALGQSCNRPEFACYKDQETGPTVCRNGTCACAEGYVIGGYNKKTCLKMATALQSPCTDKVQCSSVRGICDTYLQRCICDRESFYNGSMCLIKKGLNQDCSSPWSICLLEDNRINSVTCRSGRCACADGYTMEHSYRCAWSGSQQLTVSISSVLSALLFTRILYFKD